MFLAQLLKSGGWPPQARATAFVFVAVAPLAAYASDATQPVTISLSYEVDAALRACPSEAEFRRSVIAQLGYDPFRESAPHRVVAKLHQSEPGIEGSIVWTDANGKKEGGRGLASPAPECTALAEALSFSIAVQIQLLDTSAPKAGNGVSPEDPPAAARLPAPASLVLPMAAAQTSPLSSIRSVSVGLGPSAELGSAPARQPGARFAIAGRTGALSLELAAFGTLSGTRQLQEGRGISLNLLGLGLAPCVHQRSFSLCAVGRVEKVHVHGFGVDDPRSASSSIWQAGPRLAFQQSLGPHWFAAAHADGLANLAQRTVYLNTVPVWSTPALVLSVGIDIDVIFP